MIDVNTLKNIRAFLDRVNCTGQEAPHLVQAMAAVEREIKALQNEPNMKEVTEDASEANTAS